ncbi:hypothetical protein BJI67_02025 [Acidihalobacter aeolianus]|uniref:Uncharacterized protein n=1 Tax=Acidihalobacter aeolianus TaxID=2792603 RepID=A0A1D8K4X3_9GAMM|nr:hypothetical protein [Acidihalobacter aeolianus]AOV16011.1 hypothetical protein BJI67_02025 [Acidihalobacter aeolianus]
MNDTGNSSDGSGLKAANFQVECHGLECVNRGITLMLGIGVLLQLISGNALFHAGIFDHMWVHDALAVSLLLAMAFQLRWWYSIRPTSKSGLGGVCAQGVGVCAISLLCLTGFLGALFSVFSSADAGGLFKEDLLAHHYLVYGVWAYLTVYLVFTLARRFGGQPSDQGPSRA